MQQIPPTIENESERGADGSAFGKELRDTFFSNSKKGNVFQVILNSSGLLLKRTTSNEECKDHLINISDIIGGRCVSITNSAIFGSISTCGSCTPTIADKEETCDENEVAYLYIFAYLLKKNLRNSKRRERTVITLRFRSFDNHEDNMREAERWYMVLKSHRNNHLLLSGTPYAESRIRVQNPTERKRLLIFLNPKSGSGKARQLFNQHVVAVLNEAEIAYDLYITKHSNYASNFVRQRNVSIWSGIVAIGGDGLFHEILNGLLKRKDYTNVVNNIALGIIPCGSGNGLARSIAYYTLEPYEPKPILGAALSLVGGQSALMDVVEIEQHNRNIIYSFLSVGWGLISDIDIESERFRLLGYQRFTIWTLHRLINLRTYRGKISYLPKNNSEQQYTSEVVSTKQSTSCNKFPTSYESKKQNISSLENTEFQDVISLETVANPSHRSRCNSLLSLGSRLSTYYSIADSIYHSVAGNSDCFETDMPDTEIPERLGGNILPSLQDPLPTTWLVEDGEFVMIHAVYQTHLGSDCYFSPNSKLNDGVIYLVMIRGGISRSQLLNFLINMKSGTHLPNKNNDFIKVEKVVAFRLEPHDNKGILTVDGERIECGPLQARIFPETVNVMVPNKLAFRDC